jgi:hypothetical protein
MRHRITALRGTLARAWARYLADVRMSQADRMRGWTEQDHADDQSAP